MHKYFMFGIKLKMFIYKIPTKGLSAVRIISTSYKKEYFTCRSNMIWVSCDLSKTDTIKLSPKSFGTAFLGHKVWQMMAVLPFTNSRLSWQIIVTVACKLQLQTRGDHLPVNRRINIACLHFWLYNSTQKYQVKISDDIHTTRCFCLRTASQK